MRVDVLDKGYVELQSHMGDDNAIVSAARTSFLGESKGVEKDNALIGYLMRHEHTSPFEMVEFRFRIHAPVVVWWQLVRHRTFSLNLQSGRYVEYEDDQFYVPAIWRKQSTSNKQASDGQLTTNESYTLSEALELHIKQSYNLYRQALRIGVAREMARLFLPAFSVYYTGVVKVDLHNLLRFLRLRLAQEAQEEIRLYAQAIESIVKEIVPVTYAAWHKKYKGE